MSPSTLTSLKTITFSSNQISQTKPTFMKTSLVLALTLPGTTSSFLRGFVSRFGNGVGADCTVEYKLEETTASCGELCLSSTIAPFAEQFGGVTKGDCAHLGYTVFDHKESISVGPFGDADVSIYTKLSSFVKWIKSTIATPTPPSTHFS